MIAFDDSGCRMSSLRAGSAICFGIASLLVLGGYWSKPMALAPESSMPVAAVFHLSLRLFFSVFLAEYEFYIQSGRWVFFYFRCGTIRCATMWAYLPVITLQSSMRTV